MFFILSTGRSGSTTIARLLSQMPGVTCAHEPHPQLIKEAKEYAEGRMHRKDAVALLRRTRVPSTSIGLYGESNHKLVLFADVLCEAFPDAHYIWLVRNGLDVVASWEHRRVYRGMQGVWGQNMPFGDAVNDMSTREWDGLSPFARCCWRWSWMNRRIRQTLEDASVKRLYVRLEDLQDRIKDIGSFLGIEIDADVPIPVANSSRAMVGKFGYWDREQRSAFERICGVVMDEEYPFWRKAFVFSRGQRLRNEALSYLSYRKITGRMLRRVYRTLIPQSVQHLLIKALSGRGVLDHPNF